MLELSGDLVSGFGVGALAMVSACVLFGLSFAETAMSTSAVVVSVAVANRISVWSFVGKIDAYRRWLRGDPCDVPLAWQEAIGFMPHLFWRLLTIHTPFHVPLVIFLLGRYGNASGTEYVSIAVADVAVVGTGCLVILQGFQLLVRPSLDVMASELDSLPDLPFAQLSIGTRITAGVFAATVLGGVVTIAWSQFTDLRSTRFGVGMVCALLFGAYATVVFRVGLIDGALAPLGDLVAATRRVQSGDFATPVELRSADELGRLAVSFNEMQHGLREREALRAAFGSYVDPSLAQRLLAQGDSVFEGEEVEVSVFFADIRDFTGYSERASVRDTVATLNRFFSIVVRVIADHGGHTNSYLGDGVLGVFGTPLPLDDHADRAVAAALAVQREVRAEFGDVLRVGIGVNTGQVIAGTVGGEGKLEFTVIGDPVNVAARVEQLTKQTGDPVLITSHTRDAMQKSIDLTDRGEFDVRGKQQRVQLFSVT